MYTLEQLHIFVTVCECGSLSAAARRLGKAQSGISQAIANLEIELNQILFIREKSGIILTEAGQALRPEIESILRQCQRFDQKLLAVTRQEEHQLIVALEEGLWSVEFINHFAEFAKRFPNTQMELLISSTFDIEHLISEGKAQLGIVYKDFNIQKNAEFIYLGTAQFITVATPTHPLAQQRAITPDELIKHRHFAHRSINGQELWFSRSFSENILYANDHQTLRQLVLSGSGWADLPEKMVQAELQSGTLVRLNLDFEPNGNLITVGALHSHAHLKGNVECELIAQCKRFFS